MIDAMQERLDRTPDAMRIRRATVEHPFGTIKAWMGATHFLTKTLEQGQNRDEPPRSGLQSEAGDRHPRPAPLIAGDAGLRRRPLLQLGRSAESRCAAHFARQLCLAASAEFLHSLGQTRKYEVVRVMSAFPLEADTPSCPNDPGITIPSGSPAKSMLSINRSTKLGSTIIGFLRNARNE